MKKLISLLLIAITAITLSSCVIVTNDTPVTYTMYFCNDTPSEIYDWYLKDKNGNNYAKSEEYCPVSRGTTRSQSGLPKNYYQIWFCVYHTENEDHYLFTENYTYLDRDQIFYLSDESFSARSAIDAENSEPQYVLKTSDGQEIELKSVTIKK